MRLNTEPTTDAPAPARTAIDFTCPICGGAHKATKCPEVAKAMAATAEDIAIAKVKAMFDHDYCIHCGVEAPAPGSCEACESWWSDPSPLYVNEEAATAYLASKAVSLPTAPAQDDAGLEETRGVWPTEREAIEHTHALVESRDDALDVIAALRSSLDEAHQHVGALLGAIDNAIPYECGCDHCAPINTAARVARAWLRREAK